MNFIKNIRSYILEDELQINVFKDKVNIVNYTKIGHFDNTKVMVYYNEGLIEIKGEKLVVSKLLNNEILITGVIKNIELR